jgi:hypothetical protein
MNEKQGKHNPEKQSAGDEPYKRFATFLVDLLFFFDSHIDFPLLKVCERPYKEALDRGCGITTAHPNVDEGKTKNFV